jgi:hypothetical protein
MLESTPTFIAELLAWGVGRIVGRKFKLEPGRAHRIGEYIIIGFIAGAGLTLCIIYT